MTSYEDLLLYSEPKEPCWFRCPSSGEQHIISIVCGSRDNPSLSWALHSGGSQAYYPTLFWQTERIPNPYTSATDTKVARIGTSQKNSEATLELHKFLPLQVRNLLYGAKKVKDSPQYEEGMSWREEKDLSKIAKLSIDGLAATSEQKRTIDMTMGTLSQAESCERMKAVSEGAAPINDGVSLDSIEKHKTTVMQRDKPDINFAEKAKMTEFTAEQTSKTSAEPMLNKTVCANSNVEKISNDSISSDTVLAMSTTKAASAMMETTYTSNASNFTAEMPSSIGIHLKRFANQEDTDISEKKKCQGIIDDSKFYTFERATSHRSIFRVPIVSVYLVTTDADEHIPGLASLFRMSLPCKIFILRSSDFVIPTTSVMLQMLTARERSPQPPSLQQRQKKQKRLVTSKIDDTADPRITPDDSYNDDWTKMNIDRHCLLQGAKYLFDTFGKSRAYLILDSGNNSTMTYTATDRSGNVIGGGIGPSIRTKLRTMKDCTAGVLPSATGIGLISYIRKLPRNELSISPISSEQAIVKTILKELVLSITGVIHGWMDRVGIQYQLPLESCKRSTELPSQHHETVPSNSAGAVGTLATKAGSPSPMAKSRQSLLPVLILTGCDYEVLEMLLMKPKHMDLCDSASDCSDVISYLINQSVLAEQLQVEVIPRASLLAHHGIQHMLLRKQQVKKSILNSQQLPVISEIESVRDVLLGQRVATLSATDKSMIEAIVTSSSAAAVDDVFYSMKLNDQKKKKHRVTSRDNDPDDDETITITDDDYNVIYGTVLHIWRSNEHDDTLSRGDPNDLVDRNVLSCYVNDTLEDYYYSILWDESCLVDDVIPTELYDNLMMYTKVYEARAERDEQVRIRFEKKALEAKQAAELLASRSKSVATMCRSRNPSLPIAKNADHPTIKTSTPRSRSLSAAATGSRKKPKPVVDAVTRAPATCKGKRTLEDDKDETLEIALKTRKSKMDLEASSEVLTAVDTKKRKSTITSLKSSIFSAKSGGTSEGEIKPTVGNDESIPYVNRRIAKNFNGEVYFGYVKKYIDATLNDEGVELWYVEYDDGDAEDLEEDELMDGFVLYRKRANDDPHKTRVGSEDTKKTKKNMPAPSRSKIDRKPVVKAKKKISQRQRELI